MSLCWPRPVVKSPISWVFSKARDENKLFKTYEISTKRVLYMYAKLLPRDPYRGPYNSVYAKTGGKIPISPTYGFDSTAKSSFIVHGQGLKAHGIHFTKSSNYTLSFLSEVHPCAKE